MRGASGGDVRPLTSGHRLGLATAAVAIVALVVGLATGWQPAILLVIPGLVLFPYSADASVILLYRLGAISAASANRLGCLHVTAFLVPIVIAVLAFTMNAPALVILMFPSMILIGYRTEFMGAFGNALGRPEKRHAGVRRPSSSPQPDAPVPNRAERWSRSALVITMPLCLVGVLGLLIAASGGDGLLAIAVGFGPPIVAFLVFTFARSMD